jgi:hypothetical protein
MTGDRAGSGRQCSIGPVKRRLAFLGGIAVGAAALLRTIRRRPPGWVEMEPVDPRAEELRRKIDESQPVVEDREEFEAAETPVDAVEDAPVDVSDDPAERRKAVHAEGRSAVDRMQRATDE